MTNAQILTAIGLWVVIVVQFLREQGLQMNWRRLSMILGTFFGFLWWLCSNVSWLNWFLRVVGVQPISEHIILLLLKGFVAGLGATYSYAVIESLFRKVGKSRS